MKNRHKAAVWFVAALTTFLTSGCGDTFRPIAGPLPQPGGNPASAANAIVVSSSGSTAQGSTTQIDVSGDSTVAIHPVGISPIQAVNIGARTFVVNQGDNTVSDYLTLGGPGTSITTTTLSGSCPTFADSHDTSHLFVAMQNSGAGGCGGGGAGTVADVSSLSLTQSGVTPVGTDPESLVELASGSEVYVANKGSNNVTVINVVDGSVTQPAIAVGAAPSYVIASPDSACVYVANSGDGTVSVISTGSHTTVGAPIATGAGPSFIKFDANLGRVYVVNSGGNSLSILSHSNACTPTLLATVAVGVAPKSAAPLADGTRIYVSNSGDNTVSVVDAGSLKVKTTIAVPASPVSVAAASNSSRVYTANSGGSISIITPSNDQLLETVNAPACSAPTGSTTPACATQSPNFVMVFP